MIDGDACSETDQVDSYVFEHSVLATAWAAAHPNALPPVLNDALQAIRDDIRQLRREVHAENQHVRREIQQVQREVCIDIQEVWVQCVETDCPSQIRQTRINLRADVQGVETGL